MPEILKDLHVCTEFRYLDCLDCNEKQQTCELIICIECGKDYLEITAEENNNA